MKIDAHHHFWNYDPVRHDWINDSMTVLKRDFLPAEFKTELDSCAIDGCVAVQADQSLKETEFLLNLANENDFIKGIVGWVDLQAPNVEDTLSTFSQNNLLKGLRHVVQAEAQGFMLTKNFNKGIEALTKSNLTYDILIYPKHLEDAIALVNEHPNQQFVIDHMAKPLIKEHVFVPWETLMRKMAEAPNVYCKVSGLITEANWHNWKAEDITPFIDIVFDAFGINRVMFGSDWPVCKLAGSFTTTVVLMQEYLKNFSEVDKAKFWGENAIDFYSLVE
jgi:L-fuconolactonase